jgi:hypothetical protein
VKPAFCTLTDDGFAAQRGRFLRVKPAVRRVERAPGEVRVWFGSGLELEVARELVETERACCSFLTVDLDERERVLRIASDDQDQWPVVEGFAEVFS